MVGEKNDVELDDLIPKGETEYKREEEKEGN